MPRKSIGWSKSFGLQSGRPCHCCQQMSLTKPTSLSHQILPLSLLNIDSLLAFHEDLTFPFVCDSSGVIDIGKKRYCHVELAADSISIWEGLSLQRNWFDLKLREESHGTEKTELILDTFQSQLWFFYSPFWWCTYFTFIPCYCCQILPFYRLSLIRSISPISNKPLNH